MNMNTCGHDGPAIVMEDDAGLFWCLGCKHQLFVGGYHWCDGLTAIVGYDPRPQNPQEGRSVPEEGI